MSAQLELPGTRFGHCRVSCPHWECELERKQAKSPCCICGKKIGYQTAYVVTGSPLDLTHLACLEAQYEAAARRDPVFAFDRMRGIR